MSNSKIRKNETQKKERTLTSLWAAGESAGL